MNKTVAYFVTLGLLLLLAIYISYDSAPPHSWEKDFRMNSTQPYGLKLFREMSKEMFTGSELMDSTFYQYFRAGHGKEIKNIIIINDAISLDTMEMGNLMRWIRAGGNLWLSAHEFSRALTRKLKFRTKHNFAFPKPLNNRDSIELAEVRFTNPEIRDNLHKVCSYHLESYFTTLNYAQHRVICTDSSDKPIYVYMNYGKGRIYLNTVPMLFTNYSLIEGLSDKFADIALSYLPDSPTIIQSEPLAPELQSPLRFILKQPALHWAWNILAVALIIYLIMSIKRRHRPIPVIEPPRNATVDFVKTISGLYQSVKDHRDIALKKAEYFREFLRRRFNTPPNIDMEDMVNYVSAKSGAKRELVLAIFRNINQIEIAEQISPETLKEFNDLVNRFYEFVGKR